MIGPLSRFPRRKKRIVEVEDEGTFAQAVQHGRATMVDVVIEVSNDPPGRRTQPYMLGHIEIAAPKGRDWRVVETRRERWRPQSEGGVLMPREDELLEIARREGARFARVGLRTPLKL